MIDNTASDPSPNTAMEYIPTFREKIGHKLFPSKMPEYPTNHPQPSYADALIIKSTIHLSFVDRLRALVSGKVRLETRTVTENVLGVHTTASVGYVEPPDFLCR